MKFFPVSGLVLNLRINTTHLPTEIIYHCNKNNLNIYIVSGNTETEPFITKCKLDFEHPSMAACTRSCEVSGLEV